MITYSNLRIFLRVVGVFCIFVLISSAAEATSKAPKLVAVRAKNVTKIPHTSVMCNGALPVTRVNSKYVTEKSYSSWLAFEAKHASRSSSRRSYNQKLRTLQRRMGRDGPICRRAFPTPDPTLPSACTGAHNENCPILFKTNAEADAGDVINITGGTFKVGLKVLFSPIGDNGVPTSAVPQELEIVDLNIGLLQVKIPTGISKGVWAVWVLENGANSNVLFINRAVINSLSSFAGSPGQTLTIWGRALTIGGHAARIVFSDGVSQLDAQISTQDDLKASFIIPSGVVAGKTYQVMASNGAGGALGFSSYSTAFTGMSSGPDPLHLGVWWVNEMDPSIWTKVFDVTHASGGASAVGNGINDDTTAIQGVINQAGRSGGGTVYLPPGTYKITNTLLIGYPNVVIKGAGENLTKITYGLNDTTEHGAIYLSENNVKHVGISSMTIENKNTTGVENLSIGMFSKTGIEKFFIDHVRLNLGQFGQCISLGLNHLLIKDSESNKDTTTQLYGRTGLWGSAIHVSGTDIILQNNIVRYATNRVELGDANHLVAINNQFIRDGSTSNIQFITNNHLETGGIELSFSHDVILDGNLAEATDPAPYDNNNDGETYMTQGSVYEFYDKGNVTAATENTVTDSSQSWDVNALTPPMNRYDPAVKAVIAITRGPGLGQWRNIVSHTPTTVTVDRPWDIVPIAGQSSFAITEWTIQDLTMVDNTAKNGNVCVEIYSGGVDLNIDRTTCNNAGSIYLLGWDANVDGTSDIYKRFMLWNTSIFENVLYGSSSTKPSYIKLSDEQFLKQTLHGNTVMNAEIKDNFLTAMIPVAHDNTFFSGDGHIYAVINGAGHESQGLSVYPDALYGFLGVVISGNSSSNYVLENYSGGSPYINTPGQLYFRATQHGTEAISFTP